MDMFSCLTRVVMGDVRQAVAELGAKKLLVVADPFFKDGMASVLGQASGAEVEYFFDVEPDPGTVLAAKGAAAVKRFVPDTVVALGGGSAMDCAKAMIYFSGVSADLVAVPTTSGSGSEVTDFAVLTHEGVKHPLVDPKLRPTMAILDTALVEKLPPSLVAEGGFDALTHALEAYTALQATTFSDALAEGAFGRILSSLLASFQGDLTARGEVHLAATMAGLSFTQAGLGLCHALSHALGGIYHLPHGRLNAILLPWVMECNARGCGQKYAQLARRVGLAGQSDTMAVRNLKNHLLGLRRRLGLPGSLAEAGVRGQVTQTLVETVLADPCCRTNPVPVTACLVRELLEKVFRG